jgi:hypothetical protein
MDVDELVELAEGLGLTAEDLDDWIHDLKSTEASSINNAGMHEQIWYAIDAGFYSPEAVAEWLVVIASELEAWRQAS